MRLFVAVDLDAAGRASIAAEQDRLRERATGASRVRWVKPEHLHITMVFLGEVGEPLVKQVIAAYAEPVSIAPFDLVFQGVGVFPPHGPPRALWIGVAEGERTLIQLQRELSERARALGIPLDARPFSPHLTVGRWKTSRPADRRLLLSAGGGESLARVRVTRATLYRSDLGANGPTYTPLAHVTLTASG